MSNSSRQNFRSGPARPVLAGLLTALLFTAGCGTENGIDTGGQAGNNAEVATIAVCDLLTVEQVQALLQDEIREPRDTSRPAGLTLGECVWRADNNGRSLHLAAWSLPQWDERVELDGGVVNTVDDLGIRAVQVDEGRLYVDPGNRQYFLTALVFDTDGSVNLDLATSAAALAID